MRKTWKSDSKFGLFICMENETSSLEALIPTVIGHPDPIKLKRGDCVAAKGRQRIFSGHLFAIGTAQSLLPINDLVQEALLKKAECIYPCNWKHESLQQSIWKLKAVGDSDTESSDSLEVTFTKPPAQRQCSPPFQSVSHEKSKMRAIFENAQQIQLDLCNNIAAVQALHQEKVNSIVSNAEKRMKEQLEMLNSLM